MEDKPLDYYKALYQIATEIDSRMSTRGVLDSIVRSTAETIGVKGCSLMLLTHDRSKLIHIVAFGLSSSYIKKGTINIDPIIDEVLQGNPVLVEDVNTDERIQYKKQAKKEGIVSMLSIPMPDDGPSGGTWNLIVSMLTGCSPSSARMKSLTSSSTCW